MRAAGIRLVLKLTPSTSSLSVPPSASSLSPEDPLPPHLDSQVPKYKEDKEDDASDGEEGGQRDGQCDVQELDALRGGERRAEARQQEEQEQHSPAL